MNRTQAFARLRTLPARIVTTSEAAAALGTTIEAASHTLRRLAETGLILRIRRGLWAIQDQVEPLSLVDYLTAPYPSYVSLQTALYFNDMITQIPAVVYIATLGRTETIPTSVGTFSAHRIGPDFFGGFDLTEHGVKLATPEKALLDVFYLSGQRGKRFAALPEVEIPSGFRRELARSWIRRIRTPRLRTIVSRKFEAIIAEPPGSRSAPRGRH